MPHLLCTCNAFVNLDQYHAIVSVSTLPQAQIHNQDSRASARSWLESSMNVNHEHWRTSVDFYMNAIQNSIIASNTMTANNIGNNAAFGQALFMVGNATFDHGTLWALRSFVDDMHHPAGLTFTEYGDMNMHSLFTSADQQHTNNRLEGRPRAELCDLTLIKHALNTLSNGGDVGEMMRKEEMISAAIAQSLQAPNPYMLAPDMMPQYTPALLPCYQSNGPPASAQYATASTANPMQTPEFCIQPMALKTDETSSFIVNTQRHLIDSCCKNCGKMSEVEKQKHAKIINGLSKPYNSTIINVLKYVIEEPTLEKAEELVSMAEDLEGVHLDK
jgi:hypothetical protein